MAKNASQVLKYLLSLILAAALLYFAFRGNDWKAFIDGVRSTRWSYILLSLVVSVAAVVFRAERWRLQLVTLDPGISRSIIWHGSNVGNFLSIVIPGIGEFYRCGKVSTGRARYDKTFGTILVERAWDVIAILALLLVAVIAGRGTIEPFLREHVIAPLGSRTGISPWWIAAGAVVLIAAALYLIFAFRGKSRFCARCANAAKGILEGVSAFGKMRGKGLFLLYTAGIWTMYILVTLFTFKAVPGLETLGFADAVFISAVGNIASVVPTPGNLGAYHYIVGLAISTLYLASSGMTATALLCATLSHGSHAILIILLGAVSYAVLTLKKKN